MSTRHYIDSAPDTTLPAPIDNSVASFNVNSLVGFPTSTPWTATLDLGTSSAETILVTSVIGTTLGVTRNFDGNGAFSHGSSSTLTHTAVALDYSEANTHVNATTGVHGTTGALVGTTGAQTISDKTLVTPIVQSPAITGGATVAGALAVTGNSTLTGTLHVTSTTTVDGGVTVGGPAHLEGAVTADSTVHATGVVTTVDDVNVGGDMVVTGTVTASSFIGLPAASSVPSGAVTMFGGTTTPTGWLTCDGSAVSRTTFANLFTAIGTHYGAGNGSTTFNVPNMFYDAHGVFPRSGDPANPGGRGGTQDGSHTHTLGGAGNAWARISLGNVGSSHSVFAQPVSVGPDTWSATTQQSFTGATTAPGSTISDGAVLDGQADDSLVLPSYLSFNFIIKT